MAKERRFGKKNVIKVDPTAYNVGIIGESGAGKTTLMVETLEKLVGEDGYLILNVGREDGIDAIPNAMYEDIKEWSDLEDFIEDVVENRDAYSELKVVVIDTIDELFRITEPQVVKIHNDNSPLDKQVKSIKASFGGYQGGEQKAVELVIDNLWKLNDIGIKVWFLGHTKRKSATDVMTGGEYDTLTSKLTPLYFDAIKTKLHILGVASIKRDIETVKKRSKGNVKEVGVVTDESRIITFRDDNFNIDSKSRFAEIESQITLNSDEFINAINGAIEKAFIKQGNGKSIKEVAKVQEVEREEKIKEAVNEILEEKVDVAKNEELVAEFIKLYSSADKEVKVVAKAFLDKHKISVKDVSNVPTVKLVEALKLVTV